MTYQEFLKDIRIKEKGFIVSLWDYFYLKRWQRRVNKVLVHCGHERYYI